MWPGNGGVEWLTQKVLYNQGVILQHLPTTVLHGVFHTKLAFQFIHYSSSIFVPLFPTYKAKQTNFYKVDHTFHLKLPREQNLILVTHWHVLKLNGSIFSRLVATLEPY